MTGTRPPFQILIVDDESSLLEELNDFLTRNGGRHGR
jgi:DNA-binding response OmpR family regulator